MRRTVVLVALLTLIACARERTPNEGQTLDSGVEGIVLIGPQCPVVIEGSPCPDRPFEMEIRILALPSEREVARIGSGADGRFRIGLAPGRYRLEPVLEQSPPTASPVEVEVRAGAYTNVTIDVDSGIR